MYVYVCVINKNELFYETAYTWKSAGKKKSKIKMC